MLRLVLAIFALFSASSADSSCRGADHVLRLTHSYMDNHPVGAAARNLEKEVREASGGQLCIEVFGASTLYRSAQTVEAITTGEVDLAVVPISSFANTPFGSSAFSYFTYPFAFRNFAQVTSAWEGEFSEFFRDRLEDELARKSGLKVVALWHYGLANLASKRTVSSPNDIGQIALWGTTSTARRFLQMGKQVERLTSNSTTTADTIEFFPLNSTVAKTGAYTDVTLTGHRYVGFVLVASEVSINSLPDDLRQQLLKSTDTTAQTSNQETAARNSAALEHLKQAISAKELSASERLEWLSDFVLCPDCSGGGRVCGSSCPKECKSGCSTSGNQQCCTLSGMPVPPGHMQ